MKKADIEGFANRYLRASATAESPIELSLQTNLEQYLNRQSLLIPQFELVTRRGKFRADFMLITPNGDRIIIECDGREFHDFTRDSFRDAFILASDCADRVYRLDGETIYSSLIEALEFLLVNHPDALTEQSLKNIERKLMHKQDMRELELERYENLSNIEYRDLDWSGYDTYRDKYNSIYSSSEEYTNISNLFRATPKIITRIGVNKDYIEPFGISYIDFARDNPDMNIDELVQLWKQKSCSYYATYRT